MAFFETLVGRERDDDMSKQYSVAFKQKMVAKLIGKHGTSANRLSQETGVSTAALCQWKREAGSLDAMASNKRSRTTWSWSRKAEILTATATLEGEALATYLAREQVTLAEVDDWRSALQDSRAPSVVAAKRIKQLERELERKDKALAEAAVLLILKKKLEDYYSEAEAANTDSESEK
jgi:hypothetical protein